MLTKQQLIEAANKQFMSEEQLAFMRNMLLGMRDEVSCEIEPIELEPVIELLDRTVQEENWLFTLKQRAMQTDLLNEIDEALHKIDSGDYGYCERSGEPIDIKRLLAMPTSRLTVEEQQMIEQERSMAEHTAMAWH